MATEQTRLGRMIRLYRAHREITIRDLATEIGTSAATLLRIEQGKECDADTLLRLVLWLRSPDKSEAASWTCGWFEGKQPRYHAPERRGDSVRRDSPERRPITAIASERAEAKKAKAQP